MGKRNTFFFRDKDIHLKGKQYHELKYANNIPVVFYGGLKKEFAELFNKKKITSQFQDLKPIQFIVEEEGNLEITVEYNIDMDLQYTVEKKKKKNHQKYYEKKPKIKMKPGDNAKSVSSLHADKQTNLVESYTYDNENKIIVLAVKNNSEVCELLEQLKEDKKISKIILPLTEKANNQLELPVSYYQLPIRKLIFPVTEDKMRWIHTINNLNRFISKQQQEYRDHLVKNKEEEVVKSIIDKKKKDVEAEAEAEKYFQKKVHCSCVLI